MATAWIVRAGRDDNYDELALDKKLIAVGWSAAGDLTGITASAEIRDRVRAAYPEVEQRAVENYAIQLVAFRSRMSEGDIVLFLRRTSPDVAVGRVTGPYEYRTDLPAGIRHARSVRWTRTDIPRASVEREVLALPSLTTVYRINQADSIARLERLLGFNTPPTVLADEPVSAPIGHDDGYAPFTSLRRNLDYARSLATAGQHLDQLKVGAFEVSDVFRAAWVQSVAALDHWVRQEIRARMLELVAQPAVQKPKAFMAFQISLGLVEQVQLGTKTLVEALDQQLRDQGHLVYQNPDKIREGFGLVHDVRGFWDRVARVLTEQSGDGVTCTGKDVQEQLRQIVQRRHKIAHEYDEDPEDPIRKRPIDGAGATQRSITSSRSPPQYWTFSTHQSPPLGKADRRRPLPGLRSITTLFGSPCIAALGGRGGRKTCRSTTRCATISAGGAAR
ncbi:restriction endonuclease [Micromonospora sp. NPDC049366]|uniref:restriction endonuclease n=1 Tax=Micromonospora sp. NPDC049366 TaxID=3364271 RepID=UPI0037AE4BFF